MMFNEKELISCDPTAFSAFISDSTSFTPSRLTSLSNSSPRRPWSTLLHSHWLGLQEDSFKLVNIINYIHITIVAFRIFSLYKKWLLQSRQLVNIITYTLHWVDGVEVALLAAALRAAVNGEKLPGSGEGKASSRNYRVYIYTFIGIH